MTSLYCPTHERAPDALAWKLLLTFSLVETAEFVCVKDERSEVLSRSDLSAILAWVNIDTGIASSTALFKNVVFAFSWNPLMGL